MKFSLLALATLVAVPLSTFAQAPIGPGSIKLDKIEPEAVNTPEFNITGGQTKRSRTEKWLVLEVGYETKAEEIDELTFKFTVLFENKLLTGEVSYVNILKDREHFASVYISPKAIKKLTGGKNMTGASLGNVWVEVSRQGQKLGELAMKQGGIPNAPQTTGMILNKMQTPFSVLYYDRYEEIKPTTR